VKTSAKDAAGRDALKVDRVYAALRRRIRDLEAPPGALLKKEKLAAEFGVSRAPVSEAIARLAEEGLVEVFPQHGSFVAEIRASDLREGLFIRMGLETEAVRLATREADPAVLADLDANIAGQAAALEGNDLAAFGDLDEIMHTRIAAVVGYRRTRRLLDSARASLERFRRLAPLTPERAGAILAEHRLLVEAVRMGEAEAAADAMRAHLTAVAEAVERQLAAPMGLLDQTRPPNPTTN
jgi:GntR family transcriptional regulator, rspAB operon transcriptional repressor